VLFLSESSGVGDPGLEAAREIARMPVFGLGESGIRAAVAYLVVDLVPKDPLVVIT
jgi:hypothetical protein